MTIKATRIEAMKLLMEGSKALAQVEANGIRIDMEYLLKAEKKVIGMIDDLEEELKKDEVFGIWQKTFKEKMKLQSDKQLGYVFFRKMGFRSLEVTPSGLYKTDKATFDHIDHPFAKKYIKWKELKKALSTNINGLKNEVVDGFVHPFINLHIAKSGRTSETNPNLQNVPTRNPLIGEIIRKAIIPREGNVLIEIDFNMHEVRIASCYNKDKELIKYCIDPTSDMHRDQTINVFLIPIEEVIRSKEEVSQFGDPRFYTKNQFVFAEFFGSIYKQCAPLLWESMERANLKLKDGTPLKEHLRKKGIKKLGNCSFEEETKKGTFEYQVMIAERKLWEKFHQYAKWKRSWWEEYCKKGYFDYYTGFRAQGVMKKNEVLNFAIQGDASNCLLWTLSQMNKWLIKNKMKSMIVNEIHDSCLFDCPRNEVLDLIAHYKYLAEEKIRQVWQWLIVPLKIEVEICPHNWHDKRKFDSDKWSY